MGPRRRPQRDLSAALAAAEERQEALAESVWERHAPLPLRYWRQQTHYTVPADDASMARKALRDGTAAMARLLERYRVPATDLAARLELDPAAVARLLERPRGAPCVILDGEDAQAPGDEAARAGLRNIVGLLTEPATPARPSESPDLVPPLRFFRPPSPRDGGTQILVTLLWSLAEHSAGERFPLDGIVVPKIRHPEEIDLLDEALAEAERDLGLSAGSVRVALLIESGWAVAQLPELARRAANRLSALIYGPVDHAADIGLPVIDTGHPVALQARTAIVNVAGAVGVPAIDGMTLAYPVADPSLGEAGNRERFLDRVALVCRDARAARALGMLGKWVGHPAQLFAAMLAFDEAFGAKQLAVAAATLEESRAAAAGGRGAVAIRGEMSDRATDRHTRVLLRQAVALGRFPPDRALELGVIVPEELADARALGA